jgi:ribosomal protein L1
LPHGTGKDVRVLANTHKEEARAADDAGLDDYSKKNKMVGRMLM